MADGRVTHAQVGGVQVLRYHGRVDYTLAPAIKRFTDQLIARGGIQGWIFDLTAARILDSTNLGLIARMVARSRGPSRSVIVSSSDDINGVLYSMGFDETFDLVTAAPPEVGAAAGDEIQHQGPASSAGELGRTMLEAHQVLMTLSESARNQFKDVVACLEADAAARQD